MDEKKIVGQAIDTILEGGVDFKVNVNRPNVLHKLGILKKSKTFVIYPIKLGALAQISKVLQSIDIKDLTEGNLISAGMDAIYKYHDQLLEILAYAIHNEKGAPPEALKRFLEANLSAQESLVLLNLVIRQMSVSDFLACMVSVGRMNLMGTAQTSGELPGGVSATSGSHGKKSSGDEASQTS